MNRSLLAAPAIAALLLAGVTGIASAQDDETSETPTCEAERADADSATQAALDLGLDLGVTIGERNRLLDIVEGESGGDAAFAERKIAAVDAALNLQAVLAECESTEAPSPENPAPETPAPETPDTEVPAPPESQVPNNPALPLYADCAEARSFGAAPIAAGDPGYRPALDTDGDGTACEDPDASTATPVPGGSTSGDTGMTFGGVDLSEGIETGA